MNEQLLKRIEELESFKASLENSFSIPLKMDQAFRERFLKGVLGSTEVIAVSQGGSGTVALTGILKGNGIADFSAIVPLAGTKIYYVADSSGGAVTRRLSFLDGILNDEV